MNSWLTQLFLDERDLPSVAFNYSNGFRCCTGPRTMGLTKSEISLASASLSMLVPTLTAQLFAGSFQKKIVSSRACFAIAESRACRILCVSRLPGRISFRGTGGCRHAKPACHGRYMLCQTRTLTPRASSMDRCMFPCATANECKKLVFETLSETGKFCKNCGKAQRNAGLKFCGGCGNGF